MLDPVWGESLHQKLTKAAAANFVTLEHDLQADKFHGPVGAFPRLRDGQDLRSLSFDPAQDRLCVLFTQEAFSMTLEDFESFWEDETVSREEGAFYKQFIENCHDNLPVKSVRVAQVTFNPVK